MASRQMGPAVPVKDWEKWSTMKPWSWRSLGLMVVIFFKMEGPGGLWMTELMTAQARDSASRRAWSRVVQEVEERARRQLAWG